MCGECVVTLWWDGKMMGCDCVVTGTLLRGIASRCEATVRDCEAMVRDCEATCEATARDCEASASDCEVVPRWFRGGSEVVLRWF